MAIGRKIRRRKEEFGDSELNLVPMLDLFLSLIPFLLVSAVFLNYGGLHVEAPSMNPDQAAQATPSSEANPSEEIDLAVSVDSGMAKVTGYHKGFQGKITGLESQFALSDLESMRGYMKTLHEKYPKVISVLFHASPSTRYQDAVGVLNIVRSSDLSNNLVLSVRAL